MDIQLGSRVLVRSLGNRWLDRVAVTGVTPGRDFPVVWVCSEEEWDHSRAESRDPDAMPWPAEDVRLAEELREA